MSDGEARGLYPRRNNLALGQVTHSSHGWAEVIAVKVEVWSIDLQIKKNARMID